MSLRKILNLKRKLIWRRQHSEAKEELGLEPEILVLHLGLAALAKAGKSVWGLCTGWA